MFLPLIQTLYYESLFLRFLVIIKLSNFRILRKYYILSYQDLNNDYSLAFIILIQDDSKRPSNIKCKRCPKRTGGYTVYFNILQVAHFSIFKSVICTPFFQSFLLYLLSFRIIQIRFIDFFRFLIFYYLVTSQQYVFLDSFLLIKKELSTTALFL